MKRTLTLIGVAALLLAAETTKAGLWDSIANSVTTFLQNNPTNSFDLTGYGLYNSSGTAPDLKHSYGAGTRIGYWINPSLGAALDVSYTDSSWTFGSLALSGRFTVNIGSLGTWTPHIIAGPGWNVTGSENGAVQSVVAVAGAGSTVHVNKLPWVDLFFEYRHITTTENQDQLCFGLTKKF